ASAGCPAEREIGPIKRIAVPYCPPCCGDSGTSFGVASGVLLAVCGASTDTFAEELVAVLWGVMPGSFCAARADSALQPTAGVSRANRATHLRRLDDSCRKDFERMESIR